MSFLIASWSVSPNPCCFGELRDSRRQPAIAVELLQRIVSSVAHLPHDRPDRLGRPVERDGLEEAQPVELRFVFERSGQEIVRNEELLMRSRGVNGLGRRPLRKPGRQPAKCGSDDQRRHHHENDRAFRDSSSQCHPCHRGRIASDPNAIVGAGRTARRVDCHAWTARREGPREPGPGRQWAPRSDSCRRIPYAVWHRTIEPPAPLEECRHVPRETDGRSAPTRQGPNRHPGTGSSDGRRTSERSRHAPVRQRRLWQEPVRDGVPGPRRGSIRRARRVHGLRRDREEAGGQRGIAGLRPASAGQSARSCWWTTCPSSDTRLPKRAITTSTACSSVWARRSRRSRPSAWSWTASRPCSPA